MYHSRYDTSAMMGAVITGLRATGTAPDMTDGGNVWRSWRTGSRA